MRKERHVWNATPRECQGSWFGAYIISRRESFTCQLCFYTFQSCFACFYSSLDDSQLSETLLFSLFTLYSVCLCARCFSPLLAVPISNYFDSLLNAHGFAIHFDSTCSFIHMPNCKCRCSLLSCRSAFKTHPVRVWTVHGQAAGGNRRPYRRNKGRKTTKSQAGTWKRVNKLENHRFLHQWYM